MKKALVALVFVMLAALLHETLFAQTGGREIRLVTGEISLGKLNSGFVEEAITDSPDANRVAYVVNHGGRQSVIVDGVKGKEYDEIVKGTLLFSPDSRWVAYVAKQSGKWFVVVDGMEGKGYDEILGILVFSPNSKRVAYWVSRASGFSIEGKCFVVVDGVEGREYDGFGNLLLSPDSKRVAYWAKRGNKQLVVVDGVEWQEYDEIAQTSPFFSSDSKRLAYWGKRGSQWFIVVDDGVEGKKEYDDIFLYSSKLVFDSPTAFHTLARRDDEIFHVEVEIVEE